MDDAADHSSKKKLFPGESNLQLLTILLHSSRAGRGRDFGCFGRKAAFLRKKRESLRSGAGGHRPSTGL